MITPPTAIVLHSGGLDSTTCLAIAVAKGFTVHALSFNYGQKHSSELIAAERICAKMNIQRHVIDMPAIDIIQKGSSLTNGDEAIPEGEATGGLPSTYVPARNLTFLTYATAIADVTGAEAIFIGVSAIDYSGYPDCRPEFIQAFEKTANLGTRFADSDKNITIHTPLVHLSKAETILQGMDLGVDYAQTISCYQATKEGLACGRCDSCLLRKKGFSEANLADPTHYKR